MSEIGWVRRVETKTSYYYGWLGGVDGFVGDLMPLVAFKTRKEAEAAKLSDESVQMVLVNSEGQVISNTPLKHGWVIEMKDGSILTGYYIPLGEIDYSSDDLEQAAVFRTRAEARRMLSKNEIVRKVAVGSDGKAIEIIPGR